MSVDSKMTAIADEIRVLSGTIDSMGLDLMASHIGDANDNINIESDLILQIIDALNNKAGGTSLNFEVVGNPQPSDAKENTIWINTDVDIPEWRIAKDNPYLTTQEINGVILYAGKKINSNGARDNAGDWNITDKILLPDNTESITIPTDSIFTYDVFHSFYDESGKFISVVMRNSEDPTYTIPSGAKYFQATIYIHDTPFFIANINESIGGAVWITTDDTNSSLEFNALKTNGIWVSPVSAKQYVSGIWEDVTAMSYQNGEWVEWIPDGVLYEDGTYFVPFDKYIYKASKGVITENADHVLLTRNEETDSQIGWWTTEKQDLSKYSKLYAEVSCSNAGAVNQYGDWTFRFGAFSAKLTTNSQSPTNMVAATSFTANRTKTVYDVPLPSDIGSAYVGIQGTGIAEVYKVWAE